MSFITRIAARQTAFIVPQTLKRIPSATPLNTLPALWTSSSAHNEKKYTASWIKENRGKITAIALAAGVATIAAVIVYNTWNEPVNCRRAVRAEFDTSKDSDTLIEEFNEMLNLLILELIDQKSSKAATSIRQDLVSPESIIVGFLNAMYAKGEYEQIHSLLSVIENGLGKIPVKFDLTKRTSTVNQKPIRPFDPSDPSTYYTHDLITRRIIRYDPDNTAVHDPMWGPDETIELPFTLREHVVVQELNKRASEGDVDAIRHLILQKALTISPQNRLTELKKMENEWPTDQARAAISHLIKYNHVDVPLKERMSYLEDLAFNHKDLAAANVLAESYYHNALVFTEQLHLKQNEQLEGLLKLVKLGNESAFDRVSYYYAGHWPPSIYLSPLTEQEKQEGIRNLITHARPHFFVSRALLETFKLDKRSMELARSIIHIKYRLRHTKET